MKIVLIGSGNVATNIAINAIKKKHEILCVASKTEQNAKILSNRLQCTYTTDLRQLPRNADIYIIAVKDDALKSVISQLPKISGALFVHTAGRFEMNIFKGIETLYGVFYPMQTFSKQRFVDYSSIPCFLEANNEDAMRRLKKFGGSLSQHTFEMNSTQRKALHLAAVFACNFVNHCYVQAAQILEEAGISFSTMLPLIDETAAKVHEILPEEAQTGPAKRGDHEAVNAEGTLLQGKPDKMAIYALISQSIEQTERKRRKKNSEENKNI